MKRRYPRQAAVVLGALALSTATACGGATHSASPSEPPTASVITTPTAAAGSAPATLRPTPSTPASGTAIAPAPTRSCLSGALRVVYPGSDNPLRTVCVHVGTQVTITLVAVASYKWAPVTSSAPTVVRMLANHAADGGTLVEIGRVVSPGTATLSSTDTFTPDPHGPPSRAWQLVIRVVP
ncbi:hypothetical protein EDD99_0945 [Streptomyces sp. 846.5]|nr:hypothetical protein [Streptomyces sp. 846.5]TDU02545.1 hypothetical protein EDD99_0945 [Streptomyces sp. 846.5]